MSLLVVDRLVLSLTRTIIVAFQVFVRARSRDSRGWWRFQVHGVA